MARRFNPKLVGAFVLGAAALGAAASLYLGSARIFQRKVRFVVVFTQDLAGLDADAPVKFRGVSVGRVASIHLSIGSPKEPLRQIFMPVVVELNQSRLEDMGEKTNLGDPEIVRTLVDHGLRARLALESFLSGRRYVDLDIVPDAPPASPPPMSFPYPVIPAFREPGLESLQADASKLLRKLESLDLDGLVGDLRRAAGHIDNAAGTVERTTQALGASLPGTLERLDRALLAVREAARSIGTEVPPLAADARTALERLGSSLDQIDQAVREVRSTLAPESPIPARLEETLNEVAAMARSVRLLADSLERNPSELLRGRAQRKP